jgi:hypothetical protein
MNHLKPENSESTGKKRYFNIWFFGGIRNIKKTVCLK